MREAGNRVDTAKRALEEGEYAYCVRQCQEAVELSLKASLRVKGVEYPKFHDVGDVLIQVKEMYPEWFVAEVERLAFITRRLVERREPSFYGIGEAGLSPREVITSEIAEETLRDAIFVYDTCKKLIEELK